MPHPFQAGGGKDDLKSEKHRQSTRASEQVKAWEAKMLSGNLFLVPDVYFLLQGTRQVISGKLQKTI